MNTMLDDIPPTTGAPVEESAPSVGFNVPPGGTNHSSAGTPSGKGFHDSLPEDLRKDPTLKGFKDAAGLAKSYASLARMMGSRTPIPDEKSDPAAMKEFREKVAKVPGVAILPDAADEAAKAALWDKLGRPKSPSGYHIDRSSWPKDVPYDDKMEKAFLENAHKAGLTKDQVSGLSQWYHGQMGEALATVRHMREEARKEAEIALRKELGPALERHLGAAHAVLREFSNDHTLREIQDGLGNHPGLIRLLGKVGVLLQEDGATGLGGSAAPALTVGELRSRIHTDILDPAYLDGGHPNHDAVVSRVGSYYKQLYELGFDS
ncbi:MAG: hypothetical protein HQL51_13810 [Magnetococcales bacterium]|nr:hypothetical protein [Magnetococcales bacterium]